MYEKRLIELKPCDGEIIMTEIIEKEYKWFTWLEIITDEMVKDLNNLPTINEIELELIDNLAKAISENIKENLFKLGYDKSNNENK